MNEYGYLCYTYYLYHVPTGKKYYGYRYANRCEPKQDLWNEYFSSSDLVEALIKEYGKESFTAEVRKTFKTYEEARNWEDRVLRKLKAVEREDWLNQAYMSGPHFRIDISGKNNPNYGNRWSEEQKQIARDRVSGEKNPMFGKPKPEEELKAMSERVKGEKNPMFGKTGKLNPMFGKTGELASCYGRTGDKHPMFGKHIPEYHLQVLRKPVRTPLGIFKSVGEAAKAHNITDAAMSYRCKRNAKGCEYLPKSQ